MRRGTRGRFRRARGGFPADFTVDLKGKTVIPALFNTHAHLQIIAGMVDRGEIRQRQIAKNLFDCLECGVTNIRDTLCWDLRQNRSITEQVSRGDLLAPRIHPAVHVSPLGGTYAPKRTIPNRVLFSMLGTSTPSYENLSDSGAVTFCRNASVREVREAVDRAIDERGAETIKFCDQPEHFTSYKPGASVMAGFVLAQLGRLPSTADSFDWKDLRSEVGGHGRPADRQIAGPAHPYADGAAR